MAFHNANPRKLAFLLTRGTHEGELKKFFVDSKMKLIMGGARVQNIPHGREERVRTICERLPAKTDNTLREWFQKNISISEPMSAVDVLTYLQLHFDANEPMPEEEVRLVTRSALMYLFDNLPDADLLTFLQQRQGSSTSTQGEESETAVQVDAEASIGTENSEDIQGEARASISGYQVSELVASIMAGDESAIDNALVPFSQNTRALVGSLLRLQEGDIDGANEQLHLLEPSVPEGDLIRSALTRAYHRRGPSSVPAGIREHIPQPLAELPQSDRYEIVGICTNETKTGAIFVRPVLLVWGGKLHLLSREDRVVLFPERGDVMSHRSTLRRVPVQRDVVRWIVAEREGASGDTRFHLESELSPLIEVVRIPAPSTDPDEVRDQIRGLVAGNRAQANQQAVFLLSDGVAVASPRTADLSRDDAYEQPWQAWSSLDTWVVEGHQYCLDLGLNAASHLDLSPLETAFKKLLKNLDTEQKALLNRTQKRELADLFRSRSLGETSLRAKRIAASMDQIALDGESLDMVLGLVGARDEVQRRVDELVASEFEKWQVDKSGLQGEVDSLKRKKSDLERESKQLERANKKLADSATSSVKQAFAKAVDEGVVTLANAEVFRMLMDRTSDGPAIGADVVVSAPTPQLRSSPALTEEETRQHLMALGLNATKAVVLSALSSLVMGSNVGLVLKGSGARQMAKVLVRTNCEESGSIEIPMGLLSTDYIKNELETLGEMQRLAILNADLSPIEVYGTNLFDSLFASALDGQSQQPSLLFSCMGGGLTLPLPELITRVAVVIDLDAAWTDGQFSIDEIELDEVSLLKPLRSRIVEGLESLEGSIREKVERALVKSLAPAS